MAHSYGQDIARTRVEVWQVTPENTTVQKPFKPNTSDPGTMRCDISASFSQSNNQEDAIENTRINQICLVGEAKRLRPTMRFCFGNSPILAEQSRHVI